MPGINKEHIISLLNEANKAMKILEEYREYDKEKLLNSYKDLSVVKYHFILLIEASIDLCNHISVKLFKQVAESYAQCFRILSENGTIDKDVSDKLANFAKFRNVLVHLYWKVDDKLVVRKLGELAVFKDYFANIVRLVE